MPVLRGIFNGNRGSHGHHRQQKSIVKRQHKDKPDEIRCCRHHQETEAARRRQRRRRNIPFIAGPVCQCSPNWLQEKRHKSHHRGDQSNLPVRQTDLSVELGYKCCHSQRNEIDRVKKVKGYHPAIFLHRCLCSFPVESSGHRPICG